MKKELTIPLDCYHKMLDHVFVGFPEESCGLVGTRNETAFIVIPITNELHSPVRFRMSAEEQLAGMLSIEAQGLDLGAIYHSHPQGPPFPSETDLVEFMYPDTVSLIWWRDDQSWHLDGFVMKENSFDQVKLDIDKSN